MPAYAIGEKAADLIKGAFLNLNGETSGDTKKNEKAATISVNGNGTLSLN
jgi:hypothetical protein